MFRLDRLEISGFKSFVDPVKVDFSTGVTAIVGPNGCGKSNLADAISWVLGEQSAKYLRSHTMDDVIFSGTKHRKPLGLAEAHLTLHAPLNHPAADDGRIRMSRRVHRDGHSEYRLNGKRVPLKLIRDMLMDTGLGIRTYSVIKQGRINQILSGKPQERRKLLEEAAGITRYKARRRIALIKLEEANTNLQRLDDILSEVDRSLRSLKRQASEARRFKKHQASWEELHEKVLLGHWAHTHCALNQFKKVHQAEQNREVEVTADLHRREANLAAIRERIDLGARELARKHEKSSELAASIEGRQEFLRGSDEQLSEIHLRMESGKLDAKDKQNRRAANHQVWQGLKKDESQLEKNLQSAEDALSQNVRALEIATAEFRELESQQVESQKQRKRFQTQLATVSDRLRRMEIESEKGLHRQRYLGEELAEQLNEVENARRTTDQANASIQKLKNILLDLEDKGLTADTSLQAHLTAESELQEERVRVQGELRRLTSRDEVLRQLEAAAAQKSQSLLERLRAEGIENPQRLTDLLRVPKGWEHRLDHFLKDLGEAIVVPPGEKGIQLAKRLHRSRVPALLFQTSPPSPSTSPNLQDPGIISSLAEAMDASGTLAQALPEAYLVKTDADAGRLAPLHRGISFISQESLWSKDGFIWVEGERAQPGTLARREERKTIAEALPALEKKIEFLNRELEKTVEQRTRQAQVVHQLRSRVAEFQKEQAVAEARREDLSDRLKRLEIAHGSMEKEESALQKTLKGIDHQRGLLAKEGDEWQRSLNEVTTRLEGFETTSAELRLKRENIREKGAALRGDRQLQQERLRSHRLQTDRLSAEGGNLQEALDRWESESRRLETKRESLIRAVDKAQSYLHEALERRGESQEAVLQEQMALDEQRDSLRVREKEVSTTRTSLDEVRQAIAEIRVQQATKENESSHLHEAYEGHYSQSLPEEPEPAPENLEELERELDTAKRKLDRLGPVNILAADEYEEQEERWNFLTEQRQDVITSIASLRITIGEINTTSVERMKKTLEEVNVNFGVTFSTLFRGGEAEIRLLDDEDPLESGIEIVARPPGKRFQNLMLLSGGEKALTAIALLMALFKTKPSPFCLLDEVDAPLDDANTTRFIEMIRQMSTDTQFLVITHNKITMGAAARLYGVTMQEQGVSQLVQVDLEDLHPEMRQETA